MKSESFAAKKKRAEKIYRILHKNYPGGRSALKWQTPVQMLVATVLSAQTTDKSVNRVTQEHRLFKKYKTADDFTRANLKTFEQEIRSLGFYHNKAKNIIAACKMLRDEYG
ncbi:MAG: endonuclease III, partial [Patescibacteria group bacterium]